MSASTSTVDTGTEPVRVATPVRTRSSDALTIAWRNLLNIRRNPQLLVFATIQPVIFVLMFRYVFGGAIRGPVQYGPTSTSSCPGSSCRRSCSVRSPRASASPTTCRRAWSTGSVRCPWRARPCSSGRTLADLVRNLFVVLLMCVVGYLVGWRPSTNAFAIACGVGLVLAFSYSLSWMFAIVGLMAPDSETAQAASFPILAPLVFASSAFVPVATMPELAADVRRAPAGFRGGRRRTRPDHRWPDPRATCSARSRGSSASSRCARRSPSAQLPPRGVAGRGGLSRCAGRYRPSPARNSSVVFTCGNGASGTGRPSARGRAVPTHRPGAIRRDAPAGRSRAPLRCGGRTRPSLLLRRAIRA